MDIKREKIKLSCPSNTLKSREAKKTKVAKVVKGTVTRKKKSFAKQFSELFVGADGGNISTYLIQDIIVPTAKNIVRDVTEAITDAIKGGIEMQLFGESSHRREPIHNRPGESRTNYTKFSKPSNNNSRDRNSRQPTDKTTSNFHSGDIKVGSHREANDVIRGLNSRIREYGEATVEDLNDLLGITGDFPDSDYGWYNLNTARVRSGRSGYLIDLPRPVYLT